MRSTETQNQKIDKGYLELTIRFGKCMGYSYLHFVIVIAFEKKSDLLFFSKGRTQEKPLNFTSGRRLAVAGERTAPKFESTLELLK